MDEKGLEMKDVHEKTLPSDAAETNEAMGLSEMSASEGAKGKLMAEVTAVLSQIDNKIMPLAIGAEDSQERVKAITGIRKELLDNPTSENAARVLTELQKFETI